MTYNGLNLFNMLEVLMLSQNTFCMVAINVCSFRSEFNNLTITSAEASSNLCQKHINMHQACSRHALIELSNLCPTHINMHQCGKTYAEDDTHAPRLERISHLGII